MLPHVFLLSRPFLNWGRNGLLVLVASAFLGGCTTLFFNQGEYALPSSEAKTIDFPAGYSWTVRTYRKDESGFYIDCIRGDAEDWRELICFTVTAEKLTPELVQEKMGETEFDLAFEFSEYKHGRFTMSHRSHQFKEAGFSQINDLNQGSFTVTYTSRLEEEGHPSYAMLRDAIQKTEFTFEQIPAPYTRQEPLRSRRTPSLKQGFHKN